MSFSRLRRWRRWLPIFGLALLLGWGLSHDHLPVQGQGQASLTESARLAQVLEDQPSGAGDPSRQQQVDGERYRRGADIYVQSCGGCHLALPPQVMPSETWRRLLLDVDHYGVRVELPRGPFLQLAWEYLRDFSRPLRPTESVPYRLADSRYFAALHPDVAFEGPIRPTGCVSCHAQAEVGNYTQFSAPVSLAPDAALR